MLKLLTFKLFSFQFQFVYNLENTWNCILEQFTNLHDDVAIIHKTQQHNWKEICKITKRV